LVIGGRNYLNAAYLRASDHVNCFLLSLKPIWSDYH
jgi:hypothetical protein